MRDLSAEARVVLDDACEGDASSVAQRDRVAARLAVRLGAAATMIGSSAGASSAGSGGAVATAAVASALPVKALIVSVALVAGLVGTGVAWRVHARHVPAAVPAARAARVDRSTAATGIDRASEPAAAAPARSPDAVPTGVTTIAPRTATEPSPVASRVVATVHVASASARTTDASASETLSAESRIFGDAHAALRRRDARSALALLDQHDALFPQGVLHEECVAARIQALCALDRVDEARTAARLLERTAPRSPALDALRGSCVRRDDRSVP